MSDSAPPAPRSEGPPPIVLFFSFKGGVGRTQALASLALLMWQRGERVLVVDGDLEAPGLTLSPPFRGSAENKPGLVELFLDLRDAVRVPPAPSRKRGQAARPVIRLDHYVHHVDVQSAGLRGGLLEPREEGGAIDILPAGVVDASYSGQLDRLNDAPGLFEGQTGAIFFDALRALLLQTKYSFVLADVRTGLSQMAGMMIQRVADLVVVFTGLNEQNVEGTARVVRALEPAPRPDGAKLEGERVLLVASPVPDGEERLTQERLEILEKRVGVRPEAVLHYCPLVALSEEAFLSLQSDDTRLAAEHRALLARIHARASRSLSHHVERWLSAIARNDLEEAYREVRHAAIRYPRLLNEQLSLIWVRSTLTSASPGLAEFGLVGGSLAQVLLTLRRPDPDLTRRVAAHILYHHGSPDWLEKATKLLDRLRELEPGDRVVAAWYGHGLARLGASRRDEAHVRAGLDCIEEARRARPTDPLIERFLAQAESDLGALRHQSDPVSSAVRRMRTAAALRPDDPETLVTLGYALYRLGELKRDPKTLCEALEELKKVIELAPSRVAGQNARRLAGDVALLLGEVEGNQERDQEALQYLAGFSHGGDEDPDFQLSLGRAYSRLGQAKGDEDRLGQAKKALELADRLRPEHPPTLDAWSTALLNAAPFSSQASDLQRAYELASRARELDPKRGLYNMAVARLLQARQPEAMRLLARALKAGTVTARDVRRDRNWAALAVRPAFRKLLGDAGAPARASGSRRKKARVPP